MKSQAYASKRRLTNICVTFLGLAVVKLAFVGYLSTNGEIYDYLFDTKKQAVQAINDQKTKLLAMQNAAQAASDQRSLQNSDSIQNLDNVSQSYENRFANTASQNIATTNAQNSHNMPINNHVAETDNRVSFLPRGQRDSMQVANMASNSVAQNTPAVEPSSMVSDDLLLAQASSRSASSARSKVRANLIQNLMPTEQSSMQANANTNPYTAESDYALEQYTRARSMQVAQVENPNSQELIHVANKMANKEQSLASSLFSFVGTAKASENDDPSKYIRPDEDLHQPAPVPNVPTYTSPDSLEYKQSEINRKEEELLSLQVQMNSRMNELNALEGKIGNMVQDASSMHGEKFKHLVETYGNMKPRVAAAALTTLDEDIAIRILGGMKSKQSGEIFSYMDPVQAARLSEAMSQFTIQ